MNWYVTNKLDYLQQNMSGFYSNLTRNADLSREPTIYIDGYVIPRIEYYPEYKELEQFELVKNLFEKHERDFIQFVKGVFTIVILCQNDFFIFSDRHCARKFFIYRDNNEFFIGRSLDLISEQYRLKIDSENAAVFSLFSHYIDSTTLFKNVQSSKPGQVVFFEGGKLKDSSYWQPEDLIKSRKGQSAPISFFAEKWQKIIHSYIEYLKPNGISLTLTGGNDSRMVLAALLSLKNQFHSFSFGDPKSYDGIIAEMISKHVGLEYENHFIENPTAEWFEEQAKSIIAYGDSLINIHRAHRNDALKREKNIFPGTEMVFTGLMGGEYLKQPRYDNVVIPKLFKSFESIKKEEDLHSLLKTELQLNGINTDNINILKIIDRIKSFLDRGSEMEDLEKKFLYAYLFYGCSHHTQDINVFGQHIRYVISPFMDIDFLEMISGYDKWYLNKKQYPSHRLFHSELMVAITDYLGPELSKIPYAKKGEYTADELLRSKIKYLVKRLWKILHRDKNEYPSNFAMGRWLYDFCNKELGCLSTEILDIFNTDSLRTQLEKTRERTTEKSWHVITNPINLNLIYGHYRKK